MIRPLKLGAQNYPINLIQGPLAGVSSAPFRALTWQYGKPAFTCTEMISCKTLLHKPKLAYQRLTKIHPDEGPVCFQLSSNNPKELAEATQIATDCGAALIDLNCGCPVKKIRKKGAGSSLLQNPTRLYQLIRAMKQATHLPVSVKIRVEGNTNDKFNSEIAQVVVDAGTDFLIVHGRHWTEHYETPCRYDQIEFFAKTLSIPVIGNGDIRCLSSLTKMLATGCAGAMIGRAGVGQPWLVQKLIADMQTQPFILPSAQEINAVFLRHITELADLLGNELFALLHARKLAKYYARNFVNKHEFCERIHTCKKISELEKILA